MKLFKRSEKRTDHGGILNSLNEIVERDNQGNFRRDRTEIVICCPSCSRPVGNPEDLRGTCQYCFKPTLSCQYCSIHCVCSRIICADCAHSFVLGSKVLTVCPDCYAELHDRLESEQAIMVLKERTKLLESKIFDDMPFFRRVAGFFLLKKFRKIERKMLDEGRRP